MITISSQIDRIEKIVKEKIDNKDYTVYVSPPFEIDGIEYQVVLDGHHSLEAAQQQSICPEYIVMDDSDHDAIEYLDNGDTDSFLEAAYIDCQYYDVETLNPAF